jgi:hypothetical protein
MEISHITFEKQAFDDLGGDGGVFVVMEDCPAGPFEVLAKAASKLVGESLLGRVRRSHRRTISGPLFFFISASWR